MEREISGQSHLILLLLGCSATLHAHEEDLYIRQIRPVLQERCYACHGALKQEGGLRLDTVPLMLAGGDSGSELQPGNPATSRLLQRVQTVDPAERMPPEGEPLTAVQIAAISRWILEGAPAPPDEAPETDPSQHWAFQPPVRSPVPGDGDQNPIDAFLNQHHSDLNLVAQSPADPAIWLRRVYLDLLGIPPSPEQLRKFRSDHSETARRDIVDQLLASPHYGERWGRHWMDIWRYSDWWGLGNEVRNSQQHIWHWRDWIVESLNEDKGYNQMLLEMLAADELYPNDMNRLRATGYLARQYYKFNRTTWLDDVIQHTFKGMLGLTVNCSKCHDHKYDPISQREYYQLRAFFEPYQIRTDLAGMETDTARDGIPRAFDCNADAETWLHVRGDDRNLDKSTPINAAFPEFLQFDEFPIRKVQLPVESWQPGIRDHVIAAFKAQAEEDRAAAEQALQKAATTRERLRDSENPPAPEAGIAAASLFHDNFSSADPDAWEVTSGEWLWKNGRLLQNQVSTEAAHLTLLRKVPENFEATLRYIPRAGQRWKSVGLRFDVHGDDQVTAYLSSVQDGSKVQLSWLQAGQQTYPPQAMQSRSVPLNQEHTLTVRVQGQLVNVLVNNDLTIAHQLPFARHAGTLRLMAFDCRAEFHEFSLRALPDSSRLALSVDGAAANPLTPLHAEMAFEAAQLRLQAAEQKSELIDLRAAATRMQISGESTADTTAVVRQAADLERRVDLLDARADLLTAELALQQSPQAQQDAATKAVQATKAKLLAVENRDELHFTIPAGAVKTPESNVESEESRTRPFPDTSTGRRSALAAWITSPGNPLTARVAVNHLWNRHFGRGLVSSQFDFGRNGGTTEHPQLLDWLATEFMNNDWSMKHLHRLIVLSDAYARSSMTQGSDPATRQLDPGNVWYWKRDPTRMEAQVVRDSLLAICGELDPAMGGPPVPAADTSSRRRSLYYFHSNNEKQNFLAMFDDASVQECYRRSDSIVPQQALALENSELAASTARTLSALLLAHENLEDDEQRIAYAFETILSTLPDAAELHVCRESLAKLRTAGDSLQAEERESRAWSALILALLNHNDFLTIR